MNIVLFGITHLILFAASYVCMTWRRHTLEIPIHSYDPPVDLLTSLFCPPIGIVYGLISVLLLKMGLVEKGAQA